MKFDADYNGRLKYFSGGSEKIPASFLIVSYGPNGRRDCPLHNPPLSTDNTKQQDDIISEVQFSDWQQPP